MARVKTRSGLIEYVLRKLGDPVIDVELTEEQIDDIIDDVIDKYSEYAYDGQTEKVFEVQFDKNTKSYVLDESISTIIELRVSNTSSPFQLPGGYVLTSNYVFNGYGIGGSIANIKETLAKFQDIENFFNIPLNYTWNSNNHILTLLDSTNSNFTSGLMRTMCYYRPGPTDGIYNHEWIKDMTIAEARIQWATNIGKYSGTLINGTSVNYSDIMSKGTEDKDRLNQELLDRWSPPLSVSVS